MTLPTLRTGALVTLLALTTSCGPASVDSGAPPASPSGVVAIAGNQSVTVDWNRSSGVLRYDLYWSTRSGEYGEGQMLRNVLPPKLHRSRVNGLRIYYRVVAVGAADASWSDEVSALPDLAATAPGAPSNVVATASSAQISLSWGWVSGAQVYTVYRAQASGRAFDSGQVFVGASNPFIDSDIEVDTSYYYVVTATTDRGEGPQSAEVQVRSGGSTVSAPTAPASLSAVAGDRQNNLSWTPVAGADGYTLYWSTDAGLSPGNGTAVTVSSSPYLHGGLSNGTTYYYLLTARNAAGESPPSPLASATPSGGSTSQPPAAPTNLQAQAGDGQVSLSWSPSADAGSYTLYFGSSSGVSPQSGTAIAGVTSPFLHSGLSNGQTTFYVVTARNADGESPASNEASATPQAAGHGSIRSGLPSGYHVIVLGEHLPTGERVLQVQVIAGDAQTGSPIDGLTVTLSGPLSGAMTPLGQGTYRHLSQGTVPAGHYSANVSGTPSGTIVFDINDTPACSITAPAPGSAHPVNQDLALMWTSTHSDQALITFSDSQGTVTYPAVKPDPQGILVPGADLINAGNVDIQVSAAYKIDASAGNANLLFFGDCVVQVVLQ